MTFERQEFQQVQKRSITLLRAWANDIIFHTRKLFFLNARRVKIIGKRRRKKSEIKYIICEK